MRPVLLFARSDEPIQLLAVGCLGLAAVFLYFLPPIVASRRGHQNPAAVFAVTLLLGWTVVGWLAALVWSLSPPDKPDQLIVDNHTLRFADTVIPLKNIAYLEKLEVRRETGCGTVAWLTVIGLIVGVLAAAVAPPAALVAAAVVGVVYVVWFLRLVTILLSPRKFALLVQTNAGDGLRVFISTEENVDRLKRDLTERFTRKLRPLRVDLRTQQFIYDNSINVDGPAGVVGHDVRVGGGVRVDRPAGRREPRRRSRFDDK